MHVQLSQRVLFQQLKQFYNHHFPLGIGMMQFSGSRYYPFSFFFPVAVPNWMDFTTLVRVF